MSLWTFIKGLFGGEPPGRPATPKRMLSPAAEKLIVDFEVGGGESYYNRRLRRPTWPGASSGVTIGIGYDLGYNSRSAIVRDWKDKVSPETLEILLACSGVRGSAARSLASRYAGAFEIPWDAAWRVFSDQTIPRFVSLTRKAFPGSDKLHPDAFGALVSLVFNRGSSVSGSRRREMAAIRALVPARDYRAIAREIESMKRLWSPTRLRGLHRRRDAEAALVRSCA